MERNNIFTASRNGSIALSILSVFSCTDTRRNIGAEAKPNIVIIYADDLRFGDIGVNGAKGVKTPNIDRLAQNGVNFTDAHCSAAMYPLKVFVANWFLWISQ